MIHCPSSDVLLDLILDDLQPATEHHPHVAGCDRCTTETEALRALHESFEWARAEPMPDAWMDAILVRITEERSPAEGRSPVANVSIQELVRESLPTLGLASATVLACVTLFAPGGELGHPMGLLLYSVAAGSIAAGWEVMQSLKEEDLTSA